MIKLLKALFKGSAPSPIPPRIKAELADVIVSVQSYRVIGGTSSEAKLEESLTQIVHYLAAICQAEPQRQATPLTVLASYMFWIEPEGIIKKLAEGEKNITQGDFAKINEQFLTAVKEKQVGFVPLGQSSKVEAKFRIETR